MSVARIHAASHLDEATLAGYRSEVARLPLTMRPALNQQLSGWPELFPYEQNRLTHFLGGISSYSPAQLDGLTRALRAVENKMDVASWDFSANADTMENASLLARSPYYAQWRQEVQRVFTAIESAAPQTVSPHDAGRVVLLILPENLPISSIASRKPWDSRGVELRVDGDARRICELAIGGPSALPSLLAAQGSGNPAAASADCWLIDADAALGNLLPAPVPPVSLLEYAVLQKFRDEFLRQVNTVPKDIAATDQILSRMRNEDWDSLWPSSLKGQNRLRRFVIDVFLSGNGALIFSNAFVEWAASEALRRSRPRLLIGRFGVRSKPKPFTSIAIFENQQKISELHDEADPSGSAIDALILARYVWLSATRYPERERTCCVCVSESSGSAYVIAPTGISPKWQADRPISPEKLCAWMGSVLAEFRANEEPLRSNSILRREREIDAFIQRSR